MPDAALTAEDFPRLLQRAAADWRKVLDDRLRPLGLSFATWSVLSQLRKLDGPSQGALAGALGLADPTLVRLLDHLERDALVERRAAPDRRIKHVYLTARGEELSAAVGRIAGHLRREAMRDIAIEDVEHATALLARVQARLAELP